MANRHNQKPRIPDRLRAVLAEFGERFEAEVNDARVVHRHSNVVIALPSERLVVRITGAGRLDAVMSSVAVTGWLVSRGFPCVEPVGTPFRSGDKVVSAWRLLNVATDRPPSGGELGCVLRKLHDQPDPPFELRSLTDPLSIVAVTVQNSTIGTAAADRKWLCDRIEHLQRLWGHLVTAEPRGLIHGDAHPGNLLRLQCGDGLVLGDWDDVSFGPREWDLVQAHYMARRFKRYSESDLEQFAQAYGWDVRDWEGFEYLLQVREISGLSSYILRAAEEQWAREEVVYRVQTLRAGDEARWNPPRRQP